MIQTQIGAIDGDSWEELCQAVYKKRFSTYQEMVPSPGDWGIEGFVLGEGIAIQCYCPEEEYDTTTLHTKLVNKITKDLNKLNKYDQEISQRIGNDKIKQWIFITPRIAKNDLHYHARNKEQEVRNWGIGLIDANFTILLHDLGYYLSEIRQIQTLNGEAMIFSESSLEGLKQVKSCTEYDNNIDRKNSVRSFKGNIYSENKHLKLNQITTDRFILGDTLVRSIEKQSPKLYESISRVINQYESEISELSLIWDDSPQALIDKVSSQLKERFEKDKSIIGVIVDSDLNEIVKHIVAKWIALCPLEIEE
jgi:hypothetical protein